MRREGYDELIKKIVTSLPPEQARGHFKAIAGRKRARLATNRCGWTLDALADVAGLTPNFIGGVENGRRNPSLTSMTRIAKGLGVHLTALLGMPELSPEAIGAARLLMALPGEVRAPVAGALSALAAWATRDRT
jgi:transcriptional regulator with XRE-family HTH domain